MRRAGRFGGVRTAAMDLARIDTGGAAPQVRVAHGLDHAIDAAAARDTADRRFLTRSWFAAAGGAHPRTLVVARAGAVLLALPTVRVAPGVRAVPGAYWPFRSAPVAADADPVLLAEALAGRAARRALGPVWRLGPVYADDPLLAAVRAAARGGGWTMIERSIATSFVLDIGARRAQGPWPRASTLKKNRFHEKHLAEAGTLDWSFASGAEWTPALFDALAAIEAASWHRTSADAKFLSARHRNFWQALARDPAQAARMRAAVLRIGGEPAAFAFDLDVGPTKYAIANSYDARLGRHSPGKCLSYRMLEEAAARGVTRVDWGAGDSGYKGTIGAEPGQRIVDCLMLRGRAGALLAPLARRLWTRGARGGDAPETA